MDGKSLHYTYSIHFRSVNGYSKKFKWTLKEADETRYSSGDCSSLERDIPLFKTIMKPMRVIGSQPTKW